MIYLAGIKDLNLLMVWTLATVVVLAICWILFKLCVVCCCCVVVVVVVVGVFFLFLFCIATLCVVVLIGPNKSICNSSRSLEIRITFLLKDDLVCLRS